MGVVYRAWDPLLGRDVAVKLIPPLRMGGDDAERFRREARVVAQMDHPSIVPIHDYGDHDEALFFVMPLLEGTTLRGLLAGGRLPLGDTVEIAIQVAEALDYSHARGVIHRDVKPENVMVGRERGDLRVRVMDFGLARDLGESRLSHSEGLLVGTPAYLSPEQVAGAAIDYRSDLYALGVVLYECLVGKPPFEGTLHVTLDAIANRPPAAFAEHGVELDEELESIVRACLAKRPSDRPATGKELAGALRSYHRGLRESQRIRLVRPDSHPVTRRPEEPVLVGRDQEMAELSARLDSAATRSQVVLVAGEAGLGKTRLFDELARRAAEQSVRVVRGRANDGTSGTPYQWFCELVNDFFDRSSGVRRQPPLSDLAADLVTLFPVLSEIEALRDSAVGRPSFDPASLDPTRGRGATGGEGPVEVFELLARTLVRLAGERPLVVMVENLHLGETAAEALRYLVPRLAPTPTLLVVSYRPSEVERGHPLDRLREGLRDDPRVVELELRPLEGEGFRQLLAELVGQTTLAPGLAEELEEATEGNPLFLRELVSSLQESGEIRRDESGALVLAGQMGRTTRSLPVTIQQAIERRLDRLDRGPRGLLALAAVLGRRFDERDLLELATEGADEPEGDLDHLLDQGLLVEERRSRGGRLGFASGLVRDVIYAGIPRRRRRALHRRHALALERSAGQRKDRIAHRLLHHFYEGDEAEKTVKYGLLTARIALDAWSPEEAIRACRLALEFAEEDEVDDAPRRRAQLWHLVARAHLARGRLSEALRRAERAHGAYRTLGDDGAAAETALLAARIAWRGRRSDETRRWVHQGSELARRAGDEALLHQLLSLGATAASLRGEHHEAGRQLAEAEALETAESGAEESTGGRLVTALPGVLTHLDPATFYADWQSEVAALLFDTLFATDDAGHLVPSLVESIEAEDGGLSFVAQLRRDIRFSDGETLRAEHVAQVFERVARNAQRPLAATLALSGGRSDDEGPGLGGIEILDHHRLRFCLAEPLPIFPALLCDPGLSVVRWHGGRPLGTGPFRLADGAWPLGEAKVTAVGEDPTPAGTLELVPNPQDWRRPSVRLDGVAMRMGLDGPTLAHELGEGRLDLGRDLPPRQLEALLARPEFRGGLVESPRRNIHFVLFQTRRGPTAEHELRRALCGVVRRHELVWRTLGRFAQPAAGFLPPGILGHDAGRRTRQLSIRRARQLVRRVLAEAGKKGETLGLRAVVQPLLLERYGELIEGLAKLWRPLGVELDIESSDDAAFLDRWREPGESDLLIGRWNADYPDPDNFTHYLFHRQHGLLRRYFGSEEGDRLLERGRRESRPEQRAVLYRRFEALLLGQGVVLPLFHDIDYRLAGPTVRDLRLGSVPPYVDYRRIGRQEGEGAAAPGRSTVAVGRLEVPLVGRIETLDPAMATSIEQAEVVPNVFETLTRVNHQARVVPWLAESFEVDDSGRRYRFVLRRDVHFHDGRRLSARDVRYSFERVLTRPRSDRPRLPIRGADRLAERGRGALEGLTVVASDELVIELDEPLAFFPVLLTHPSFAILPEDGVGIDGVWRDGSWRDGCVGTGPFRILRFEPGGRLDLEAHPGYWRAGRPRAQQLIFHGNVTPERIASGFREGRLSLASDLRREDFQIVRQDATFAVGYQEAPRLSTYFLALNTLRGVFAEVELRQAFVQALGPGLETLVGEGLDPIALRAEGLLPPGLLGHESVAREMRSVRRTLEGLCIQVAINPAFEALYGDFWRRLRKIFEELGIEMVIVHGSAAELIEIARRGEVDLLAQRWIADYPDPDNFVMGLLHSSHGVLAKLCGRPQLDGLVELGRQETDPGLRHALYREIEELIYREALLLPLFHEQAYRFVQPSIEGLRLTGLTVPEVCYDELEVVSGPVAQGPLTKPYAQN